eukprot:UN25724
MLSLGKISSSEYDTKSKKLLKSVTGTEISEATRQKASIYVFGNATRESIENSTENSDKKYNTLMEFEREVPQWDKIKREKATKFEWDAQLNLWREQSVYVKMAKKPFCRGSLRYAYFMLDLTSKPSHDSLATLLSKNQNNPQLKVAKVSIDPWEPSSTYFDDLQTQAVSSKFAKEYNRYEWVPKKVAFLNSWVYRLDDRCTKAMQKFVGVEDFLVGKYEKHLDNHGGDEGKRNTPAAFAHFTY